MEDDRQDEDEDKQASEEFTEPEDLDDEQPFIKPECPHDGEGNIECEFDILDGGWWCLTHNCWA